MKKNILIIEDEFLIQQSLKKLLQARGANVVTTASGNEAIKLIIESDFNRIVCDLMLQDISGFDVIEESRKKYNLHQIQEIFIIMTAYSSVQVLKKANEYKCHVVQKPFEDMNSVLDLIINNG